MRVETLIRNHEVLRAAVARSARTDHTLTQQQCTDLLKEHNLEGIKGASLWGSGRNHKFFSGKGVPPLVSKEGDHYAVHQRWQQAYQGWLAEPEQPKKKKRREQESEELLPRSGRVNLLLTALEQNSSMAAALLPALEELPNMVERAVARAVKPEAAGLLTPEPPQAAPAPSQYRETELYIDRLVEAYNKKNSLDASFVNDFFI